MKTFAPAYRLLPHANAASVIQWREVAVRRESESDISSPHGPHGARSCINYAIGVVLLVLIVETPIFTKRVRQALDEEQYRLLQTALIASPGIGKVIPGSGGIRKLRWVASGRGKRGGTRIIYQWFPKLDRILMLFIFLKNERVDLSLVRNS